MAAYRKPAGPTPAVLIIAVVAVLVFGMVLVLSLGNQQRQTGDRSTAQPVNDRVVQDLQRNDMQALYAEMSPSLRELFTLEQLLAGENSVVAAEGEITLAQVLEPPSVKTGPEWNGEWADAKVQISRGTTAEVYVARYHLENGQWWFFGTIKLQ